MRVTVLVLMLFGLVPAASLAASRGPAVRGVDVASSVRAYNLVAPGLRMRVEVGRGTRAVRVDLVRVRGGRRVARSVFSTGEDTVVRLRFKVRDAVSLAGRGPYELRVQGGRTRTRFSSRVVRRRLAVTPAPSLGAPAPAPAPEPVAAVQQAVELPPAGDPPAIVPSVGEIPAPEPMTFTAVGDTCGSKCDLVADLVRAQDPDRFLHLGDMQYQDAGTGGATFKAGYEKIFAGLHDRTIPVFGGTHDTCDGTGGWECYPVSFFNANGAPEVRGRLHDHQWGYGVDLPNGWHVLGLNYRVATPADVAADLAGRRDRCVIALVHAPVYGSPSKNHPTNEAAPFADALNDGGVDVIVSGHQHFYERNQYPQGFSFTVGTGSATVYARTAVAPTAVGHGYHSGTSGALELSLGAEGWNSTFRTVNGAAVDPFSGDCAD